MTYIPPAILRAAPSMRLAGLRVTLAILAETTARGRLTVSIPLRELGEAAGLSQRMTLAGAREAQGAGLITVTVTGRGRASRTDYTLCNASLGEALPAPNASLGEALPAPNASPSEAFHAPNASLGEAFHAQNASLSEARGGINTRGGRGGAAIELWKLAFGVEPNPTQAATLARVEAAAGANLAAVMTWAANEDVRSPSKILAAANRWSDGPRKKDKPHGNGKPLTGDRAASRAPDGRPGYRPPDPARLAQDRRLAEERKGKLRGMERG